MGEFSCKHDGFEVLVKTLSGNDQRKFGNVGENL